MRRRRGFTLIEVLIATSLLGFSLVVMFGFHTQAVRSNMHARKLTDCVYLAQGQLEELLSLSWTKTSGRPDDLKDGEYHLNATLVLGPADSHTSYAALEGETAVLSGGPRLHLAWSTSSLHPGVFEAPLPPSPSPAALAAFACCFARAAFARAAFARRPQARPSLP